MCGPAYQDGFLTFHFILYSPGRYYLFNETPRSWKSYYYRIIEKIVQGENLWRFPTRPHNEIGKHPSSAEFTIDPELGHPRNQIIFTSWVICGGRGCPSPCRAFLEGCGISCPPVSDQNILSPLWVTFSKISPSRSLEGYASEKPASRPLIWVIVGQCPLLSTILRQIGNFARLKHSLNLSLPQALRTFLPLESKKSICPPAGTHGKDHQHRPLHSVDSGESGAWIPVFMIGGIPKQFSEANFQAGKTAGFFVVWRRWVWYRIFLIKGPKILNIYNPLITILDRYRNLTTLIFYEGPGTTSLRVFRRFNSPSFHPMVLLIANGDDPVFWNPIKIIAKCPVHLHMAFSQGSQWKPVDILFWRRSDPILRSPEKMTENIWTVSTPLYGRHNIF